MPVGAKLNRNRAKLLKGVREQEQLALGINSGALKAFGIPGVANFQPLVAVINIAVAGGANNRLGGVLNHDKRQRAVGGLKLKRCLHIGGGLVGMRDRGIP